MLLFFVFFFFLRNNYTAIYILIVCTNVLSFFSPRVSSGNDFPSRTVGRSVKSIGLQFCHALVLLNGLIQQIMLFFHLCLHSLTRWTPLVWKRLSGSSEGHGATGGPGAGPALTHGLCQQTPALRGDNPAPGSSPGLQWGGKGDTGPLWGSEESARERAPKVGRDWVQAWTPAGLSLGMGPWGRGLAAACCCAPGPDRPPLLRFLWKGRQR